MMFKITVMRWRRIYVVPPLPHDRWAPADPCEPDVDKAGTQTDRLIITIHISHILFWSAWIILLIDLFILLFLT